MCHVYSLVYVLTGIILIISAVVFEKQTKIIALSGRPSEIAFELKKEEHPQSRIQQAVVFCSGSDWASLNDRDIKEKVRFNAI